jgi:hypothetical protein
MGPAAKAVQVKQFKKRPREMLQRPEPPPQAKVTKSPETPDALANVSEHSAPDHEPADSKDPTKESLIQDMQPPDVRR